MPDLGDQQKQVQSFVDDINANGGINGRKINLHFKLLDVLSGGADAIQAACIEATQEFKAAVVILPPAAAPRPRPLHGGHQQDADDLRHRHGQRPLHRVAGTAVHPAAA